MVSGVDQIMAMASVPLRYKDERPWLIIWPILWIIPALASPEDRSFLRWDSHTYCRGVRPGWPPSRHPEQPNTEARYSTVPGLYNLWIVRDVISAFAYSEHLRAAFRSQSPRLASRREM